MFLGIVGELNKKSYSFLSETIEELTKLEDSVIFNYVEGTHISELIEKYNGNKGHSIVVFREDKDIKKEDRELGSMEDVLENSDYVMCFYKEPTSEYLRRFNNVVESKGYQGKCLYYCASDNNQ